jgi:hypothetical protein
MEMGSNENKETKQKNTKLRRSTMNATKLTMIGLAAAAIVFGGCSRDNRVTGPGTIADQELDEAQFEFVTPAVNENAAARIAAESFETPVERIGFEATVGKVEVEGGCWYLENEKGVTYTPHFESSAPSLYVGKRLHVFGYIDRNLSSYCMIGPVFTIEKYENLYRDNNEISVDDFSEAADKANRSAAAEFKATDAAAVTEEAGIEETSKSAAAAEETGRSASNAANSKETVDADGTSQADLTILRGFYGSSEKGCFYLYNEKGILAELYFTQKRCPNIQNGALIAVKGGFSLLAWSPCQLAQLFNVEKFQVLDGNDFLAQDGQDGK